MSYQSQGALAVDGPFTSRVSACLTQQSQANKTSDDPAVKAHAEDFLSAGAPGTGGPSLLSVWMPIMAAEPGLADTADTGDGIDSSLIIDEAILASVQAQYPQVAALLYEADGTPKP